MRKRFNPNEIIKDDCYDGYRLMQDKGPYVRRYLDKIIDVMDASLDEYPRTYAFRVDLNLPKRYKLLSEDRVMDRFISSFKSKIRNVNERAKRRNKSAATSNVRYVWAREEASKGRPHWHMLIFLNYDAFRAIGKYEEGRDNIFNRLTEAWAGALRLTFEEAEGLVHMTDKARYRVTEQDFEIRNELFHRASYMAKTATKVQRSRHCFGGSRN